MRLAADSGARRGELAALRFDDLTGRVLHIQRAVSAGQLTTPKSGYGRTLTLGADTAALWHRLRDDWTCRLNDAGGSTREAVSDGRAAVRLGPWLFSAAPDHQCRLGTEALGHRFEDLRDAAGVPTATLHRLRHTVATFLVSQGKILEAQVRLGHGDASTTLREYSHALPGRVGVVADAINDFLDVTQNLNAEISPPTTSDPDRRD